MHLHSLDEPLLQFADGSHTEIRAGIVSYGVFDRDEEVVSRPIRVGLVGTSETTGGILRWLESSHRGVLSTEARLRDLRPDFPGMTDLAFGTAISTRPTDIRTITTREFDKALASPEALAVIVDLFLDNARDLANRGTLDVLVIAPPVQVFKFSDANGTDDSLDESSSRADSAYKPCFHDLFKARALELPIPCQVVRPDTYGGGSTQGARRRAPSLQDVATRAWNFHTALYYKAGGVPWRLVREASELSSCYLGVSFYKSPDRLRVLTSVAQVFNERGEGVIVQGGNARVNKTDLSPHLSQNDMHRLLSEALATYRREHKTSPARIVVHKTSYFDDEEIRGCNEAADDERISVVDLVSVRKGGARLFRSATFPVLRGTALELDETSGLIYLRGSVPQFQAYPGMYIPSSFEFQRAAGETSVVALAREMLELSKLNFNNTQFDGGSPITIRAARRVGDILKHVPSDRPVRARFRYFT